MSRIGKMPIDIPNGVKVTVEGNIVTAEGPKGKLEQAFDTVHVSVENNQVIVTRDNDLRESRSKHGLYRTLIHNMVTGVSEGFKKVVVINGVGYKMNKQGNKVTLNIGKSHPEIVEEVEGITLNILDNTKLEVSGIDKEKVGQFAANIRALKKVEPYHLYGIRYLDEVVVKKEGKKAGKK